jgi:hypothetical protein
MEIKNEKNILNDAKGHATLITRPVVHPRPSPGNMTGWHTNPPAGGDRMSGNSGPVVPDQFPPTAGGVLEGLIDTI